MFCVYIIDHPQQFAICVMHFLVSMETVAMEIFKDMQVFTFLANS